MIPPSSIPSPWRFSAAAASGLDAFGLQLLHLGALLDYKCSERLNFSADQKFWATPAPSPRSPGQRGDNAGSTMRLPGGSGVCLNFEQQSKATKERARRAQGSAGDRGRPGAGAALQRAALFSGAESSGKDGLKTEMRGQKSPPGWCKRGVETLSLPPVTP